MSWAALVAIVAVQSAPDSCSFSIPSPGGGLESFTRRVNGEFRRVWEAQIAHDANAQRKIEAVGAKIANILSAVEGGLGETAWANRRLAESETERGRLVTASEVLGKPPQIDAATAMSYGKRLPEVLRHATPAEEKELVRAWVEHMRLAPERLQVEITYRIPEPVVNEAAAIGCGLFVLVAGPRFEADSERLLVVSAHWRYWGAQHAEREMARVGPAS